MINKKDRQQAEAEALGHGIENDISISSAEFKSIFQLYAGKQSLLLI